MKVHPRDLTLEHVSDSGMMGKRAPDDEQHCVALCWGHHLGAGERGGYIWALASKHLTRVYLATIYGRPQSP